MATAKAREALRLSDVGEMRVLTQIRRCLSAPAKGVLVGAGEDDAAVLRGMGPKAVISADMLVEGQDFEHRWASPRDIGHKAAAVNLSDLAAMGAKPRGLVLGIAARPDLLVADVLGLVSAVQRCGRDFGAPVVGGDLSSTTGPTTVCVTALGEIKGPPLRRNRGRVGDVVLVSGDFGAAAAGLLQLMARGRPARISGPVGRQLRPLPRVELGLALARWGGVSACTDVSDGISGDVLHLPREGLGVDITSRLLPISSATRKMAAAHGRAEIELALSGGEDFELAFSVAAKNVAAVQRIGATAGAVVTPVGEIVRGPGLQVDGAPWQGHSYDHFLR